VRALEFVERAYQAGYRDIVVEAPTGIGKGAIGAAVAAWIHAEVSFDHNCRPGAYILVQQKVLQDQIERELDRLGGHNRAALIKASVEYPCPRFKRCSSGLIQRRCDCLAEGSCTYRLAKRRFMGAVVAVTNYAYFFTERLYAGQLEPRHGLVLDECHGLSRIVTRFSDCKVSEEVLERFAPEVKPAELRAARDRCLAADGGAVAFATWLEEVYLPAAQRQAALLAALKDNEEAAKDVYEVQQHCLKVGAFIERVATAADGWVFWDEERDGKVALIARPLDAAPYFKELVGTAAPLRLYMSAFPGEKAVFCRELGLEPDRVAWLRLKSPFAVKNRAVHLLDVGSMSRAVQEQTLPAAMRVVAKIAAVHPDRGVIHTHSYRLAEAVAEALRVAGLGHRLVYPKAADEREAAMQTHAVTPGAILVSPSVAEGFDFRGDLARWQVIVKVQYPSLGDKHTAALAARDGYWYKMEAAKAFLQTCGRVCRSEDDHGVTFVVDSDIFRLLRETGGGLPRWFKAAIFTRDGTPLFADSSTTC
jgi:Rad3-related DNA helicase